MRLVKNSPLPRFSIGFPRYLCGIFYYQAGVVPAKTKELEMRE